MSVEQGMLMSEIFPLPSTVGGSLVRWVTQLSKIAVTQFQDQTHTRQWEKGLWAEGTREISGKKKKKRQGKKKSLTIQKNTPGRLEEDNTKQGEQKKKKKKKSEFWWIRIFSDIRTHTVDIWRKEEEQKKNTKAIFFLLALQRGQSGHFTHGDEDEKG